MDNYTVNADGTLEVIQIEHNGTWYCYMDGRMYSIFSVTTTEMSVQPQRDVSQISDQFEVCTWRITN